MKRFLSGLTFLFLPILAAPAVTYYVATNGNDGAAGTDWSAALLTITNAVVRSSAGDLVLVSNGTYNATGLGTVDSGTNFIYLNKAITLKSFSGNPEDTILHGNGMTNRLVYIPGAGSGCVLDGFTLTNGYSWSWVGGGLVITTNALITNCIITGCRSDAAAPGGGGVYCAGPATMAWCRVVGNAAMYTRNVQSGGGGIYCASNASYTFIITNCDVGYNSIGAGEGGGICASRNVRIYNSHIFGNTIVSNAGLIYGGGGVAWYYGGPYLKDCVISNNIQTNYTGYGSWGGGAKNCILDHCWVLSNTGVSGGGVYGGIISNGTVIAGNYASSGGGGHNVDRVYDSLISNNIATSSYGGGLNSSGANTVISNCLILNNLAINGGGGGVSWYYLDYGNDMRLVSCRIIGNLASNSYGGGMFVALNYSGGTGLVQNCLFANNVATNGGGYYGGGLIENRVLSCSFASNRAVARGGGVYSDNTFSNCIIASNTAGIYPDVSGDTNRFWYCCVPSLPLRPGQGNFTNDPGFVDYPGGNYRLAAGAPCINAGTNQPWMGLAYDLDNTNNRIINGRTDIGCYEFTNGTLSVTFGADRTWALAPSTNIFTALASGTNTTGLYYSWDFTADGTPDLQGNDLAVVTNIYAAPGYYSVALTVTNAVGESASLTNMNYLKVGPLTYYVATNGTCQIPYTNWAMAVTSLYAATRLANDGDTVLVSNGVFFAWNPSGSLPGFIDLNCGMTIRSLNGPAYTSVTRTPGINSRVFVISRTNAALVGLTITNGFTTGPYGYPLFAYGGGVYMSAGGMISNCVIARNTVTNGGGGIYMSGGLVVNSVIRDNLCSNNGAGIMIANYGTVRNCLIVSNRVTDGVAAIALRGGGIFFSAGGTAENCTVVGNLASNVGGGVFCTNGGRILNSIIVSNSTLSGLSSNWYTNGAGISFSNCCTIPTNDLTGTGNIQAEPLFVDYAVGNYRLAGGSPGVDAGTNQDYWMPTGIDFDGQNRIFNSVVDIGAYERSLFDVTAAPTNVQASDGTYVDQVMVIWATNACTNATGYQVFRSIAADTNTAGQIGDASAPSYADLSTTNGVLYYYWVRATNAYGVSDLSVSNTGFRAIVPPTGVSASDGSYSGKVVVTWATNVCTNASGYFVWRNNSNDAASALNLGGTSGPNYDDTTAVSNTTYYYWVQATNTAGAGGTNSYSTPDTGYWAQWYYVATNGSDGAAGIDWGAPLATISNGVALAQRWAGGGVLVSNGEYTVTNQVAVTNGITVAGFNGRDVTFINGNYPTTTNRAFWLSHSDVVVDGFTITNCVGGDGGGGGGVYIATNGRVVNCVLAFNQSTNTGYAGTGGGGIFMNNGGLLTNCVISNNTTLGSGGGVGGGAHLYRGGVLSNCVIVANVASNTSGYAGAGVWINITAAGQTSRVSGCVFSNNVALGLGYGGGLYLKQDAGSIDAGLVDNCTFVTNIAPYNGGGLGCTGGGIVSNCAFLNNVSLHSSAGYGAGAAINGGRIINCTNIVGNSGYRGGGIYLVGGGRAENCWIISNRSVSVGGGISMPNGNGLATGCVIMANWSPSGGGFYADYGAWTVQDCVISNNSAQTAGGGIYINGRVGLTGLVERCEIVTNSVIDAGNSGGGMYISWQGGLIRDCTFRGNSCFANGGGIYCQSWTGRLENCLFTENRNTCDAGYGYGAGAAYLEKGVKVHNCVFTKNVGGSYAGAARLESIGNDGGEFSGCTVVSNKGAYTGGLRLGGTNNIVLNSVIYSNIATATTSNDLYLATDPVSNTLVYNCTPVVLPGESNLTAYPKFVNPAGGDWRLNFGSPCINAGTNQDWMAGAADKDGHGRILGGTVEMGAYEYPLYPQASPTLVSNTLVSGVSTGTLAQLWSSDTNIELNYAASSTNAWITLGVSNGAIAVNTTNTLWVTNSAAGQAVGTYTGQVYVVSTNGQSALYPPATQTVTVIMTILPMGPPTGVAASDGAYSDRVVVTWDTNLCTNATGYAVWRSLAADTNTAAILSAASGPSYADTSATNGVLYYYWVQATNTESFSELSESNTGYRALAPPTGVSASDGSYSGKVVVTWATNVCTNAAGYIVWRNYSNDAASAANLASVAGTNYDDTSTTSNILYYYWVQATNTLSQTNVSLGGPDSGYWALTYYVATNGSDTNAGLDWAAPCASISNGVVKAQRYSTGLALVSNGTYTVTVEVAVTNSIRVRSWNGGAIDRENTLISGGGAVRGFNVNHALAVIEALTVTNGAAPNSYGGGIYLSAGLVTNCVLSGNWATNGGGISLHSANAVVKNSLIAGNAASNAGYYTGGGGLWMSAGVVTNCDLSNNAALWCGGGAQVNGGKLTDSVIVTNRVLSGRFGAGGGGVLLNASAATVANCTIMGNAYFTNAAEGGGGGVAVISGGLVTNCTIVENRSYAGGGVYFQGANNQVMDCLISNNTAYYRGGGITYYDNNALLQNCRVIGNTAGSGGAGGIYGSAASRIQNTLIMGNSTPNYGGGVYAVGGYLSACTIVSNYATTGGGGIEFVLRETAVTNSIIFSNKTGAAWSDIGIYSGGNAGTASLYYCCTSSTNGLYVLDQVVTNAPQFINFAAGNFRLGAGSPGINVGTNETWMDTAIDLQGRPRIRYGRVDMGCYEYLLNVKVNGVPIDRILRINGVDKNRIFRISE